MPARKPDRSQVGARAAARERLAARVVAAEAALGHFLDAAEAEERHRRDLETARTEKERALREMVRLVGMAATVEMAGLSERAVRSAVARRRGARSAANEAEPAPAKRARKRSVAPSPPEPADAQPGDARERSAEEGSVA